MGDADTQDEREQRSDELDEMLRRVAELYSQGKSRAAIPLAQEAVEFATKHLGADHSDTATSLNNLGVLLDSTGDYASARPYYEAALAIHRRVLGADHPDTAFSLNNLGFLLQAMGDYAGARLRLEEALTIRRRVLGDDHPNTANSLNNLGVLLQATGDYAGARPHFEQALAIYRRVLGDDHPDTANSLNNLGFLLNSTGDFAGARPHLEEALAIRRRVLGDDHPDTAFSLNNLGVLLRATSDYAGARPYFEQALAIRRRALGDDHPDTAASLNNLGLLLDSTGDYAGARPYYEAALAIHRRVLGDDHPDTAITLVNLSLLLVAVGDADEAWYSIQKALAIEGRLIAQVFSLGSERQRASFLQTVSGRLDCFLSLLLHYRDASPPDCRVALDMILRRKGLGAEALAAERNAVLGGHYPRLQDRLAQLSTLREQVARATLAGPGPEGVGAHRRTLTEWAAEKERLEAELARQVPEMSLERNLRAADRRAIALNLDAGVALVEFVRFNESDFHAVPARGERRWRPARYLAFVLRGGDPDAVEMIDLGEADPIDRLIAEFRSSVSASTDDRPERNMRREARPATGAGNGIGAALREALFNPLLPAFGGRTRLLVSPDGQLARLPFAALPTTDGQRLADQYQISYIGTGREVLRFAATAPVRSESPLVLCDPDFDLGSTTVSPCPTVAGRTSRDLRSGLVGVQRLPGTLGEGRRVGELLRAEPWYGPKALKQPFLKACRSPLILHLATHGFFLEAQQPDLDCQLWGRMLGDDGRLRGDVSENPLLRSGLVLAGANTFLRGDPTPEDADTGLLTSLDVTGLDLLGTELVVLSACETGLGDVQVGEGVMGLQRAFTIAGARSLVMSLWSVDDEATRELMVSFYHRLLAGEGKADALRHAQDELRSRPEYADPYYWAAFVLLGDPGPLSGTTVHP